MEKVLLANYYRDFVCKCGECRHPCCDGWGINVSRKEYFSLLGMDCSEELRRHLDSAFVVEKMASEDCYATIRPNYLGDCPMLREDGLCALQREKGEDVLPLICRVYPRSVKVYGGRKELCTSCSCEKTLELLLESKEKFSLIEEEFEPPFGGLKIYGDEPEKDEMRHKIIEIIAGGGALKDKIASVYKICCGEDIGAFSSKEDAIKAAAGFTEVVGKKSGSIRFYAEKAVKYIRSGDASINFEKAEKHLLSVIPHAEEFAAKAIANHVLFEGFPYNLDCESVDTAFAAFVTACAILKFLCVCAMHDSDDINEFIDIAAFAGRFIEHSDFYSVASRISHPSGNDVFAKFGNIF